MRMISFHGYQNCLAPPTSKPSCDRYTQPPKIKPTPPFSPDDALHAQMSIMAIEADFQIRKFFFFFCLFFFTFQKDKQNHGRGRSIFWKNFFSEMCRHVIAFLKSEKGHIEVIPHHHTIMGTKGDGQGRRVRSMEVGEVIWVEGE